MAGSAPVQKRNRILDLARDMLPLAIVFAFLYAVSFLPPDTSLGNVDRLGRLSVCMPESYPPLVTGDPDRPGFDVEVLEAIAERRGWRLNVVSNAAMGRDFNPRNWRINRAQCQILAGGIALNRTTQSFLDTSAPHLVTGWAYAATPGTAFAEIDGPVGVLAGLTGLDRIALGQYLRAHEIPARIVDTPDALRKGLESGEYSAAITESLLASRTFSGTDYEVSLMPPPLERIALGFGFWKGDLTLKRRIERILGALRGEGILANIGGTYSLQIMPADD